SATTWDRTVAERWRAKGWPVQSLYAAPQASKPDFADAYEGAREDLAIWKRRALEAERDLRAERETSSRLVAELNAQNGPTHMGEPAPQASDYEVVGEVAFSYEGEKVGAFYGDAPPIETLLYIASAQPAQKEQHTDGGAVY